MNYVFVLCARPIPIKLQNRTLLFKMGSIFVYTQSRVLISV